MSVLISVADLALQQAHPLSAVVLDASFDLQDPQAGTQSYVGAHVPGARYVHLERDLCGPKTDAHGHFLGRHPLPDRRAFAQRMGQWGIKPQTRVVVYDRQGSMLAARLWWMLRWMGHAWVQVLDGGWAAWQAAGLALEQGASAPDLPAPAYPDNGVSGMPTIDAVTLRDQLAQCLVIDARAPERFRGEVEPLDRVAGHIPGAYNRFFKDNLLPDGRFKSAAQLRTELAPLGQGTVRVVQQCGSGITACHNLLAMCLAGWEPTTLYPGSWSEWSAQDASFQIWRPI